jgi:hypothetical protein
VPKHFNEFVVQGDIFQFEGSLTISFNRIKLCSVLTNLLFTVYCSAVCLGPYLTFVRTYFFLCSQKSFCMSFVLNQCHVSYLRFLQLTKE